MLYLMNSTVMPVEGVYVCKKLKEDEVAKVFVKEAEKGWKSYVGYPQTAMYMAEKLGVDIEVNREQITELKDGDTMLVCKLKYRVSDPATKGEEVDTNMFEWYLVKFGEVK